LQILDDGRLTDNKGKTVDFKNTIIIMTSNIGSNLIQEYLNKSGGNENYIIDSYGELKSKLIYLLRERIRPEFLNRIDEIVMFNPLNKKDIREITNIQIKRVQQLTEKNNITIEVTDETLNWLAAIGYDISYGARPLKRTIQKYIVNPLSQKIIEGAFGTGDTVLITLNERGMVSFEKK